MYLKKRKATKNRPVDMQELIVKLPTNRASISRNCKKLRERGEIKHIQKKEKNYNKFLYFI